MAEVAQRRQALRAREKRIKKRHTEENLDSLLCVSLYSYQIGKDLLRPLLMSKEDPKILEWDLI